MLGYLAYLESLSDDMLQRDRRKRNIAGRPNGTRCTRDPFRKMKASHPKDVWEVKHIPPASYQVVRVVQSSASGWRP